MSDYIYCEICGERRSLDEVCYLSDVPEERQAYLKSLKKLSDDDFICQECEENYED